MAKKKAKAKKRSAKKKVTRKSSSSSASGDENPFGAGLLRFLEELEATNTKPWFEANKARYESDVREPALVFIRAMAPRLAKISPNILALDKKVGGSLMRIHRDVRFSKDKSPYKTNLGIQFRHVDGKDVHAPGYYFHIDPKDIFIGAGMWHPESASLNAVRVAIDADPATWRRIRDDRKFRESWNLEGEFLKTAPRGYPKDHPELEDLRRKDHIAVVRLKKKDVTRADLIPFVADLFTRARPYMAWQADALELDF